MAKIEQTKMTVSLDNDSKRVFRDLTKAINKLVRSRGPLTRADSDDGEHGVRRLSEDLEPGEAQLRRPYVEDAFN